MPNLTIMNSPAKANETMINEAFSQQSHLKSMFAIEQKTEKTITIVAAAVAYKHHIVYKPLQYSVFCVYSQPVETCGYWNKHAAY